MRLVVASCACAVVALASCGSFEADTTPGADAGTSLLDGSADAATEDGGGGTGKTCPDGTFCEHFDDPGWEMRWSSGPSGLSTDTAKSKSAPASLLLEYTPQDSPRWVSRSLEPFAKAKLKVSVLVEQRGNGEIDLFGVSDNAGERGIWFIHDGALDAMGFEYPVPASHQFEPSDVATGTWTDVTIEIDLTGRKASLRVGALPLVERTLPDDFLPSGYVLFVGASYGPKDDPERTKDWRLRYDDVEITLTP